MSSFEPHETRTLIQRITAEIERLSEEQNSAMRNAAVIGMTEQEAREYRQRGAKITELVTQVGTLQVRKV